MALVNMVCTACGQNTTVLAEDINKRGCPNCGLPLGQRPLPRVALVILLVSYSLLLGFAWWQHYHPHP
jgi:hypothetical protein